MTVNAFFLKTQFQSPLESKSSQIVGTNHHCPLPRLGQIIIAWKGQKTYLSVLLLTLRGKCEQKDNMEWSESKRSLKKRELDLKPECLKTTPNYMARSESSYPNANPVSGHGRWPLPACVTYTGGTDTDYVLWETARMNSPLTERKRNALARES